MENKQSDKNKKKFDIDIVGSRELIMDRVKFIDERLKKFFSDETLTGQTHANLNKAISSKLEILSADLKKKGSYESLIMKNLLSGGTETDFSKRLLVPPPAFASPGEGSVVPNLAGLVLAEEGSDEGRGGERFNKQLIRRDADAVRSLTPDFLEKAVIDYVVMQHHLELSARKMLNLLSGTASQYMLAAEANVLMSTSAIGFTPVTHSFIEEFGAFSLSVNSDIPLKSPVLEYLRAHDKRNGFEHKKEFSNVVASYPRGKNSGVPIIVSGGDRVLNDILLFHNMLIGSEISSLLTDRKISPPEFQQHLNSIKKTMTGLFGELVFLGFDRLQHTGKAVPKSFRDGKILSYNFEPRRRVVNGSVKPFAMALKPIIKATTNSDLSTPMFSQDRKVINERIRKVIDSGGFVMAFDQSRFDLRHGGDKQVLANEILAHRAADLTSVDPVKALMLIENESDLRASYIHDGKSYLGDGKLVLKSGESGTSRKGSYMNANDDMMISMQAFGLNEQEVVDMYLEREPSAILGDDLLKFFSSIQEAEAYEKAVGIVGKLLHIGMEIEHPTKFLGSFIDDDPMIKALGEPRDKKSITPVPWKNSAISSLQKIYFPEMFKKAQAIPLALEAKMRGVIESHPNIDKKGLFSIYRNAYDEVSTLNHPLIKQDHKDVISEMPRDYNAFQVLTKDMLANPSKYGLDNDFGVVDEILNIFGRGLQFDADLDRVGLSELKGLSDVQSFESKLNTDSILASLKEVVGGAKKFGIPSDFKGGALLTLLDAYNTTKLNTKDPVERINGFYEAILVLVATMGINWQPGSYAFAFRFSKGREIKRREKELDQELIDE